MKPVLSISACAVCHDGTEVSALLSCLDHRDGVYVDIVGCFLKLIYFPPYLDFFSLSDVNKTSMYVLYFKTFFNQTFWHNNPYLMNEENGTNPPAEVDVDRRSPISKAPVTKIDLSILSLSVIGESF